MFEKLAELIRNKTVGNLSRDERNNFFEYVANASENQIAAKVGEVMKELIMSWWYAMCDVREKERKGG